MRELLLQLRWLFFFRLVTLAAAAFVLPRLITPSAAQWPWLAGMLLGLIGLWTMPFWGAGARQPRVLGLLAVSEAVAIAALVDQFGRLESPFSLLFLPMLAQAAALLPPVGYTLVASIAVTAFVLAIIPEIDPAALPFWTPLLAAAVLLLVAWLGVLGEGYRAERLRHVATERRFRRFRQLVARLPLIGRDESGWRGLLGQIETSAGFVDGALVIWEGPRARVVATDRQPSWEALVRRHAARLRQRLQRDRQPEIFVEAHAAGPSRSIVCWPLDAPPGEPSPGALCLLADAVLTSEEAGRRLRPWLPLATLALAANRPDLTVHPAPIDWRVLMNVTLHRLHKRLAQHLVLVHVEPGLVEADGVLLADAIAQVIEDALDRVPPHTQVRLDVRRTAEGWAFRVHTDAPAGPASGAASRKLLLAQQVVAAHGGEWRAMAGENGYQVGFLLPVAALAPSADVSPSEGDEVAGDPQTDDLAG